MKCVIAGSRGIDNYELLDQAFTSCVWSGKIQEIVSGRAKGVDKLGEELARKRNLKLAIFPAEWDKYGKSAGYKRNEVMAKYTDMGIILWDGKSRGTKHMIDLLRKYDKPCEVVIVTNGEITPNKLEEELFII